MKRFKYVGIKKFNGVPTLVQGVKGLKKPKYAKGGGNGSYIVCSPSELILSLKDDDNNILNIDIIKVVRKANGWDRITDKRINKIKERLKDEKYFYLDEYGIRDILDILKVDKK